MLFAEQIASRLVDEYSNEGFIHLVDHCREYLSELAKQKDSSDFEIARSNIYRYVDRLLSRAREWIHHENDLLAFILRNLIEVTFWVSFIRKGDENVSRFLQDAAIDSRELWEKIYSWGPEVEMPPIAFPEGKRVQIKRINDLEELIYKACSKFIHPTSFVINNPSVLDYSPAHQHMAIQIIYYAWLTIEGLHPLEVVE